jgi:hypothetical protein
VAFAIGGRPRPTLADSVSFAQKALDTAGAKWRGWNVPG